MYDSVAFISDFLNEVPNRALSTSSRRYYRVDCLGFIDHGVESGWYFILHIMDYS
jgi:hypothetical protein